MLHTDTDKQTNPMKTLSPRTPPFTTHVHLAQIMNGGMYVTMAAVVPGFFVAPPGD